MLKRAMRTTLLLAAATGMAAAAPVFLDFSGLNGPQNIARPFSTGVDQVTFQYDPESDLAAPPPPACGFNATDGTGFTFSCVGAQADTSGLQGTTDGTYILDFATPASALNFMFGIYSTVGSDPSIQDPPLDEDYFVSALFVYGGVNVDVAQVSAPLVYDPITDTWVHQSSFAYTGRVFSQVMLNFSPYSQIDKNGGMTYGQTIVSLHDVSFNPVPEPSALMLLGLGLAGIGLPKLLRRRKA